MTASLGGLDVLAFTGGIGQNSCAIRRMATAELGFLGVSIDEQLNERAEGDRDISAAGARVSTLVIDSREDLEMARQVRATLEVRGLTPPGRAALAHECRPGRAPRMKG